jgi:hypothetical protein
MLCGFSKGLEIWSILALATSPCTGTPQMLKQVLDNQQVIMQMLTNAAMPPTALQEAPPMQDMLQQVNIENTSAHLAPLLNMAGIANIPQAEVAKQTGLSLQLATELCEQIAENHREYGVLTSQDFALASDA